MHHQVLANQPGRVGESIGELAGLRIQEKTGSTDPVGADDHGPGQLALFSSVAIDVNRTGRKALVVDGDLPNPRAGHKYGSMSQSRRPVGVVRGSLCALWTASQAGATSNTLVATLIRLGWNRIRRRPPMPAQLVHPFGSF